MIADIVLLSGKFDDPLFLCRTYKIIKAYLGVAKRDLKLHGNVEKKRFHALRSLIMAEKLMENVLPDVGDIQMLKFATHLPSKEKLFEMEKNTRERLNNLLNLGDLDMYPVFEEEDSLVKTMLQANNTREFRY
jgi:hypothetical protein